MILVDGVSKPASVLSGRKSALVSPEALDGRFHSSQFSYTVLYNFAMANFQMMN